MKTQYKFRKLLQEAIPYLDVALCAAETEPDEYLFEDDVPHLRDFIEKVKRAVDESV